MQRKPLVSNTLEQKSQWSLVALVGLLLAYANADAFLATRHARPLTATVNLQHLWVLAACLAWAGAERLSTTDLGLGGKHWLRSLCWGVMAGLAGGIVIQIFFRIPSVAVRAVTQPDLSELDRWSLSRLLFGQFLLSTAVFEEFAFRGLLNAKLVRQMGERGAILCGSAIFCAWHTVITWHNLRAAGIGRVWFPISYAGAMGVLYAAGLGFGLLRYWTGHIVGSVAAHWLLVSAVVISLARRQSPALHHNVREGSPARR